MNTLSNLYMYFYMSLNFIFHFIYWFLQLFQIYNFNRKYNKTNQNIT